MFDDAENTHLTDGDFDGLWKSEVCEDGGIAWNRGPWCVTNGDSSDEGW